MISHRPSRSRLSAQLHWVDFEQLPFPDARGFKTPGGLKGYPGTGGQVPHGAGHEDLPRGRTRMDPRRNLHCAPIQAGRRPKDAFAGMQPGATFDPQVRRVLVNRAGGPDGPRRPVEQRQRTIRKLPDSRSAKLLEMAAQARVVKLCAETDDEDGRQHAIRFELIFDLCNESFHFVHNRLLISKERNVVDSWEFDKAGVPETGCNVTASFNL
jgi:hypothetical protein